jgi:RNA polymerase sigma factor (sigma-70 family)
MCDDPVVIMLVARARDGDQYAWNEIVDRYAPLVWSICQRYGLSRNDTDDIGQTVWLLLVEQLGNIRQPAALPGWLATTTHRECMRAVRGKARSYSHSPFLDETQIPLQRQAPALEEEIIEAELGAALRAALAELPDFCRRLLSLLLRDPPLSYQEISDLLPIRVGSIGPQRKRCLNRIRRSLALADHVSHPGARGARTTDSGGVQNA